MPTFRPHVEPGQTWTPKDKNLSTEVTVVSSGNDFVRIRPKGSTVERSMTRRIRRDKFLSAYSRVP